MRWLLSVVMLCCLTVAAQSELLVEENFDYDVGDLDGMDGGSGFGDGWEVFSEFTFEIANPGSPMTYNMPGGGTISGGETALRFGNDEEDIVLENEVDALTREFATPIDADDVYFSFLYRYDEDGFIDNNDFVVWYFNSAGGPQFGLKGNGGDGSVPDDIVGRVNGQFAPPHQAYVEEFDISDEEGNLGTDFFIVGKISRADASDDPDDYDQVSVWVDPSASDADSPHAIGEALPEDFLDVSLNSLGLRAFNQEPGDAMWWDALRIGTTWESVTSPMGGQGLAGDFNGNGDLDVEDIDALSADIRAGATTPSQDLTGDGLVNDADRAAWVVDLKNTWFGDANLDGEFNSSDFVQVFTTGKFETDIDATWSDGDWNGDGRFNSSDFVAAFSDGGFEIGPRPAVANVPEPSGLVLVAFALLGIWRKHK